MSELVHESNKDNLAATGDRGRFEHTETQWNKSRHSQWWEDKGKTGNKTDDRSLKKKPQKTGSTKEHTDPDKIRQRFRITSSMDFFFIS